MFFIFYFYILTIISLFKLAKCSCAIYYFTGEKCTGTKSEKIISSLEVYEWTDTNYKSFYVTTGDTFCFLADLTNKEYWNFDTTNSKYECTYWTSKQSGKWIGVPW